MAGLRTESPRLTACKAAMNSLSANLRGDLRETGIVVTLVIPGMVATLFSASALHAPQETQEGPPGAQLQTAAEVAAVIIRTIEQPVPEIYTNPAHAAIVAKYYQDVAAFETG